MRVSGFFVWTVLTAFTLQGCGDGGDDDKKKKDAAAAAKKKAGATETAPAKTASSGIEVASNLEVGSGATLEAELAKLREENLVLKRENAELKAKQPNSLHPRSEADVHQQRSSSRVHEARLVTAA